MLLAELAIQSHNAAIMKKSRLSIDDLRSVLESTTPTSKLGRWLTANKVAFERLLKTHRPRWEALAVKFAEEGVIAVPPAFWGKGDSPARRLARKRAGEAARQVWQRVKRKQTHVGPTVSRSPSLPAPRRRQSPSAALRAPRSHECADDDFRPARPRNR
jgi:hypothetical protein